jgi:UDP-2,3-diacylglucosamine pyrophosphatase LpxH
MFYNDNVPVVVDLPSRFDYVDIYFIHDVHFGSELFDEKKWNDLKEMILAEEQSMVCFVGDLMENAIPNSKSDMFQQKYPPSLQKEWVTQQLTELAHKTIAVVPGNHESNRTTKVSGLYPLYDCCLLAGIGDKYRDTIAFIDIGLGKFNGNTKKKRHYFGQIQHRARDTKAYHSSDYTDGIDFFVNGHDHEAKDRPRAKLVFDKYNKTIYKQNVECLNCGSFCEFGGYGAKNAYRPQSDKMYKLRLYGHQKRMETTGFYVGGKI